MKNLRFGLIILRFVAYLALPVILLSLPADHFDTGDSVCLSVSLFDTECYGCGMTSAIQHLIHFDFELAFAYNMLSFIVLPLLVFLWASSLLADIRIMRSRFTSGKSMA